MDDEATSAIQELIYETNIISTSIMNVCNMLDRLGFECCLDHSGLELLLFAYLRVLVNLVDLVFSNHVITEVCTSA